MTFTPNDVALLGITLLIGLFIGLMVSGRGKYKRLWRDERQAHTVTRRDRDARVAAANDRIAEQDRQNGPIGAGTAAAIGGAVRGRDDLTRIRTISANDEIVLNEAGYHRFRQIATLTTDQQAMLEARLGRQPGLIVRDEWPEQARLLEANHTDEHVRRFEKRKTAV
jgi:predicted flap endonuclease-1-like 5' DNA nuclease